MTPETKNKWSVWINLILTTVTAVLATLGFNVYAHVPGNEAGHSSLRNEAFSLYEDENEAFQAYEAGRPRPWYNKLNSLF